ncbi:MAG: T9SS type A sorting domain-containing protein, partial [Bacteroidota bacterium]
NNLNAVPVVPDTAQIIIAKDTSKLTTSWTPSVLLQELLQVYPNPATNVLWVHSERPVSWLRLTGADGHIWLEQEGEAVLLTQELSVGDLPPGIYFLQVWINDETVSRRIAISSP